MTDEQWEYISDKLGSLAQAMASIASQMHRMQQTHDRNTQLTMDNFMAIDRRLLDIEDRLTIVEAKLNIVGRHQIKQ